MTAQFRNLIFEGGGVKGIAYVGAMQVLQQRGIYIKRLFAVQRSKESKFYNDKDMYCLLPKTD